MIRQVAILLKMQHGRRPLEPGPVNEIAQGGGNRTVSSWLRLREYLTSRFLRPDGTSPKDFEKSPLFNAAIAIMTRKGGARGPDGPHRPRPFRVAS
jgi:hypothetical protein